MTPCRRCGNRTEEADGLHGDCRVRLRREIDMYTALAIAPGHSLSLDLMRLCIRDDQSYDSWSAYYQGRVEKLQAVLEGETSTAPKRRRKGKTERPTDPPTHVGHSKAPLVTGERPKKRSLRR